LREQRIGGIELLGITSRDPSPPPLADAALESLQTRRAVTL
jgi:hypothetical protein